MTLEAQESAGTSVPPTLVPTHDGLDTLTDVRKDPRSGKFLKGHKPYITRGNANGRRGRPGKDDIQAWEWARGEKPKVIKALVKKAIAGYHPSIELYLAYIDGRPVETFKTFNLTANVSAEDIRELDAKIEAHRLGFMRELGISATQTIDSAAQKIVAEVITDTARTPGT